jgi:hypothetical protein
MATTETTSFTPLTSTFNTPQPVDASMYPYNNVTQTRAGHVFEVDDTLGNERIHEMHKSGTYRTIEPDGAQSTTVVSDRYTTVCGNDFVSITGTCNIHINGNCLLTVNGNYNVEVNGNMEQTVKGEYKLKVGNAHKTEVTGDKSENVKGKKNVIAGQGMAIDITAGGVKTNIIGGQEKNVSGDYTSTVTGSSTSTALFGISMQSPLGKASFGGMSASLDAVSNLTLTSLGPTAMYSTVINATTPIMNVLGGAIVAGLDVCALGGTRTLATHFHLGDGAPGSPAPTTPPIA